MSDHFGPEAKHEANPEVIPEVNPERDTNQDADPGPEAAFAPDGYTPSQSPSYYQPPYHPIVTEIVAAAIFLTRLPLPFPGRFTGELFGRSMGWFPLIGLVLGGTAGLVFGLLGGLGLPSSLAAVLTVALLIATTGALHEDGLADSVDGLCGGRDREDKLAIMRDSRLGTYGTLALIFGVGLRVTAVAALPSTLVAIKVLAVAGAMSRAAMVAISHWLPPARSDGLSATLGGPAKGRTLLAIGLAVGFALLILRAKALIVLAAAALVTAVMIRQARLHLGGQTGDVLGATQQLVEIMVLVLLVVLR
ncbi:MAG: adenosylcobinamide-GDP ribazoletransferase [Rhodospirillaceae bacterium]